MLLASAMGLRFPAASTFDEPIRGWPESLLYRGTDHSKPVKRRRRDRDRGFGAFPQPFPLCASVIESFSSRVGRTVDHDGPVSFRPIWDT